MPMLMMSRKPLYMKRGRGIDGQRLTMCSTNMPEEDGSSGGSDADKEKMSEIVDKLAKIKIINPRNGAKAKREIKNKYITI